MEAPVQVGAAEPLDIPGQETVLLSERDRAFGAPKFGRGFGWFHILAMAFFRFGDFPMYLK